MCIRMAATITYYTQSECLLHMDNLSAWIKNAFAIDSRQNL